MGLLVRLTGWRVAGGRQPQPVSWPHVEHVRHVPVRTMKPALHHNGSQAMFHSGETVRSLLTMYDAWDEDYFVDSLAARFRVFPHGRLTHAARWRLAQEFTRPVLVESAPSALADGMPAALAGLWCDAPSVAATAVAVNPGVRRNPRGFARGAG